MLNVNGNELLIQLKYCLKVKYTVCRETREPSVRCCQEPYSRYNDIPAIKSNLSLSLHLFIFWSDDHLPFPVLRP